MKRVLAPALLLIAFTLASADAARADSPQFDLSPVENNSPSLDRAYLLNLLSRFPQQLQSAASGQRAGARTPLPVVSTGSVDFNTVDLPFIRSNGGQGAFPSGSASAGAVGGSGTAGNGSSQIPPDLPPGYAGVMCHGVYAGAIPPGGNIVDFWKGAYGFAGDAQQQAALLEEGKWLAANGQLDGL